MKSTFLVAVAALMAGMGHVQAQAVRNDVILEVATGTWCQYCPGAALGADELFNAGAHVGVVEHHNGDAYTYASSDGRNNYYNVQGFPTAWFDGGNALEGGSHTQSLFPSYRLRYEAALATPTPFSLAASWTQNGASIDVSVDVTQVGAYSGANLRLQAALTESNIIVNWQGLPKCDFVNRAMYPDFNGTAITTTQGGPTVNQTFNMAIDPTWVQQEMQLVVWLEDASTKQIYNGKMMTLSTAANPVDAALVIIDNEVAPQSCITSIAPEIVLRNLGGTDLTAATITYDMNGGTPMVYNWTGTIPYYGFATVTLPSISFTNQATNTLTVSMSVPSDASSGNDLLTKVWAEATTNPSGTYTVRIKPDSYGSEITWDLKNSAGTVLFSGGPYVDGNTQIRNIPVALGMNDCFTFNIYDLFGDGICCGSGNGYYKILTPNGTVIYTGGDYGVQGMLDFKTDNTVRNLPMVQEEISISPNPSHGRFEVKLATAHLDGAAITVMSTTGQTVFETTTNAQSFVVDLGDLASGIYLMRVQTATGAVVKKLQKD